MGIFKKSKYYDMNIHTLPDAADSPCRMILEAKHMGFSGATLVSCNPSNTLYEHGLYALKDFEVFSGIEILTENLSKLNIMINRLRPKADILIISGGNEDVNRAAIEDMRVDILAHPAARGKALNHIVTKAAADNGVAIDFNIDALTMQRGGSRVKVLTAMRQNVRLARKYDASMILTSNAWSHYDLRGPREMMALGILLGMTEEEAVSALTHVPLALARRNTDGSRVMEGVEVVQ